MMNFPSSRISSDFFFLGEHIMGDLYCYSSMSFLLSRATLRYAAGYIYRTVKDRVHGILL